MKSTKDITQLVEETFQSIDGMQRAAAPHFLYTRIQCAMEKEPVSFFNRIVMILSKPVVAIVCFIIILTINSFVVIQQEKMISSTNNEEQLISQEYSVSVETEENLITLNEDQP